MDVQQVLFNNWTVSSGFHWNKSYIIILCMCMCVRAHACIHACMHTGRCCPHRVWGGLWTTFEVTSLLSPWALEISQHLYLLGHAPGSVTIVLFSYIFPFIFILCIWYFVCMHVCLTCTCSTHGSLKRVLEPQDWSYNHFKANYVALGIELRSSGGAASALY